MSQTRSEGFQHVLFGEKSGPIYRANESKKSLDNLQQPCVTKMAFPRGTLLGQCCLTTPLSKLFGKVPPSQNIRLPNQILQGTGTTLLGTSFVLNKGVPTKGQIVVSHRSETRASDSDKWLRKSTTPKRPKVFGLTNHSSSPTYTYLKFYACACHANNLLRQPDVSSTICLDMNEFLPLATPS